MKNVTPNGWTHEDWREFMLTLKKANDEQLLHIAWFLKTEMEQRTKRMTGAVCNAKN